MKHFLVVLLLTGLALGQQTKPIRVFVSDHESWQQASTIVAGTYSGATHAEQVKTLAKGCPAITITDDQARANFFVAWDSKTWQQTSWGGHENEFTVYNSAKDMIGSGAAHHMKNAAKDICKLLTKTTAN
jgi:predicted secreted Zn-dependent protease